MKINGKIHCFFEQSGTFKGEFIKLGYKAEDYDIQNNFGETNHVSDLFSEIDNAYDGKPSIFDGITEDDLILAFYPCIFFCESSQCAFRLWHFNYRKLSDEDKIKKILARGETRHEFMQRLVKFVGVCLRKKIRLVIENPWSGIGYLKNNFLKDPDYIDMDRTRRGDHFKKPTAFWFFNCEPGRGFTFQPCPASEVHTIRKSKGGAEAGLCSEDRSMISKDYARNFICDQILDDSSVNPMAQQLTLW